MDKRKYASTVLNSKYQKNLWTVFGAGLLISNMMLAYFVVTADTSEKTIITPPHIEKPFSVRGDEIDASYVEQMARYFSQLLLTYHKRNAEAQFDTVLHYTDPAIYSEMQTRFMVDVDRISRNGIASVFYLMNIHIKKNTAIIQGEQNAWIGSQLVSTKQKTYQLTFNYDGQLTITGFNELHRNAVGGYDILERGEDMMIEVPVIDDKSPATDVKDDALNGLEEAQTDVREGGDDA